MTPRRLTAADAADFQRLRLFGLQESPSAFGSSFEDERERSLEQVQAHLEASADRVFFGVFDAGQLLGIVGVGREEGAKERHRAFVRSLYVAPSGRGRGMGRSLLQAAMDHAQAWEGVEQVGLAVTAGNGVAMHLYGSLGFVEVGCMPRALRVGDAYFDEIQMLLGLPVA